MTEKQLQDYLIKKARQNGLLSYKVVAVGRPGFPDVLLVDRTGGAHFIELKSPKGTGSLRAPQRRTIKQLEEQNANVSVISSREGVDAYLRRLVEGAA